MTCWDIDRGIEALSSKQHGAFNRLQGKALGATSRMFERRVANKRWLELGYPVYALPGNPPTWERQAMAATLSIGGAALCGPAGGALHEFIGLRKGNLYVAVLRGSAHKSKLAVVRQMTQFEVTRVDRIPVLTPACTLVDLAGYLSQTALRTALFDAIHRRPDLLAEVQDRVALLGRRRSKALTVMGALLRDLGDDDAPSGTELERALDLVLIRVPGIPLVFREVPFPWRSAAPQRVDRLIEGWRLILEADSRAWHTRVDDFERDRERDNEAAIHGYGVLRFTWSKLTKRADEALDQITRYGARFRRAA